jgi:hypothetical protein
VSHAVTTQKSRIHKSDDQKLIRSGGRLTLS